MLALETVLPFLSSRGLVSLRSVVEGDLLVTTRFRRNLNYKVTRKDGSGYLIKQGVGVGKSRTVKHEATVYQHLMAEPGLRNVTRYLPRFCLFDPAECALVLELLRDTETIGSYHRRRRQFPVVLAEALGRALATLHRDTSQHSTAGKAAQPFPKAFLNFPEHHRPSLATVVEMCSATQSLVKLLQATEDLCSNIERVGRGWRRDSGIHGDLRWDNCHVVAPKARCGGPPIRIVDWELAGLGDSSWDTGTVFSQYLAFWLLSMPIGPRSSPLDFVRTAPFRLEAIQPAIRAFWRCYSQHMGLEDSRSGKLLLRSIEFAAVRLIQEAQEETEQSGRLSTHAIYLVQLATNILKRPIDAAAHLLGLPIRLQ